MQSLWIVCNPYVCNLIKIFNLWTTRALFGGVGSSHKKCQKYKRWCEIELERIDGDARSPGRGQEWSYIDALSSGGQCVGPIIIKGTIQESIRQILRESDFLNVIDEFENDITKAKDLKPSFDLGFDDELETQAHPNLTP